MERKRVFRIQPRVPQETYTTFKKLAERKGTNPSNLARQIIDNFIKLEALSNEKTPV
jgi:predicted DNA-binding protein